MICLIVVVFIAELIILYNMVDFLLKTDREVCLLTEQVNKSRMKLKWRLCAITEITEGINEIIPTLLAKARKTKRNILMRTTSQVLQGIILLFFKPKYKKILLGIKTGTGMLRKVLKV